METFLILAKKNLIPILGIIINGMVGILLMATALYIFERIIGCNIKKELSEQNLSIGIPVAAIILGTALIAMSAIQGRSHSHSKASSSQESCGTPSKNQQAQEARNLAPMKR